MFNLIKASFLHCANADMSLYREFISFASTNWWIVVEWSLDRHRLYLIKFPTECSRACVSVSIMKIVDDRMGAFHLLLITNPKHAVCTQLPPFICAILPSNCLHDESRSRRSTYVCRRYCKVHSREFSHLRRSLLLPRWGDMSRKTQY